MFYRARKLQSILCGLNKKADGGSPMFNATPASCFMGPCFAKRRCSSLSIAPAKDSISRENFVRFSQHLESFGCLFLSRCSHSLVTHFCAVTAKNCLSQLTGTSDYVQISLFIMPAKPRYGSHLASARGNIAICHDERVLMLYSDLVQARSLDTDYPK